MNFEITVKSAKIKTEILLPSSKSISNRVQLIKAICKGSFHINNLSQANDSMEMAQILSRNESYIDAGDGGTTLRFLIALYALRGNEKIITGSEALRARPLSSLINALRELGASIDYLETEGQLPIKINKGKLSGNTIAISGSVSSQFISALMMVGPGIPGGLTITIENEILSLPYILMTKSVMEYFGAEVSIAENIITIRESVYTERDITIEPDWSAASYWYEIAALSDEAEILLIDVKPQSLQGDAVIAGMMENFGVSTTYTSRGALLVKNNNALVTEYFKDDFSGCPDLGPAVIATCAGLNITADLTGLKNFRLKESDRAASLQRELYNMNVKTDFCGGSKFKVYKGSGIKSWHKPVNTYNDHRMAMCFAPLSLETGSIKIQDAEVVKKSYPGYFDDLIKGGFQIMG